MDLTISSENRLRMWGGDVYQNFNDPEVSWYSKLTPRGDDAAIRYNKTAYSNAITAVLASRAQAVSLARAGAYISSTGAKVIGALTAGITNSAASYYVTETSQNSDGSPNALSLAGNFLSGYFGAYIGQSIPNPVGAPPTTFATSIAGTNAAYEHLRAQIDQLTQALGQLLISSANSRE